MQIIRYTQKLQKEMGLKKSDLAQTEPEFSFLGSWHANLLHIDRKKCVLLHIDRKKCVLFVPDVNRPLIKELDKLSINNLFCILASEGLSEKAQEAIRVEY